MIHEYKNSVQVRSAQDSGRAYYYLRLVDQDGNPVQYGTIGYISFKEGHDTDSNISESISRGSGKVIEMCCKASDSVSNFESDLKKAVEKLRDINPLVKIVTTRGNTLIAELDFSWFLGMAENPSNDQFYIDSLLYFEYPEEVV